MTRSRSPSWFATAFRQDAPTPACHAARNRRPRRQGFSLLEFEVALIVLGLTLSGLFPVVVMYSRGLESLEQRSLIGAPWYVVPSSLEWARKLGASASIASTDPGPKPAAPDLVVDDGDSEFATVGTWDTVTGGYQGDHRRHNHDPHGSSDTATWTFLSIPSGWYQIQTTWVAEASNAETATYSFLDGAYSLGSVSVNQQNAPLGTLDADGVTVWQTLTTQFIRNGMDPHTGARTTVQLSVPTSGKVIADAVRLVLVENNVQVLSMDRVMNSEAVSVHVSVQQLVPH